MRKKQFVLAAGGILLFFLVTWIACTVKSPAEPVWEVNFVLPLLDKIYNMSEQADEIDELSVDAANDQMVLDLKTEIETFEVGDYLKSDGGEATTRYRVPPGVSINWSDTDNGRVILPADVVVTSANIKSGWVRVIAENKSGYQVDIGVEIPSLTIGGNPLPIQFNVNAGQNVTEEYVLDNTQFAPGGPGVDYISTVTVVGGAGSTWKNVDITLEISEIFFSEFTGILNRVEMEIEEIEEEIDFPEQLEGFAVETATATLTIENGVGFPAEVDFRIYGENEDGEIDSLIIQGNIDPSPSPGVMQSTTLPPIPNVADFFNMHPTKLTGSGKIWLGEVDVEGTATEHDSIKGLVSLWVPLVFMLPADHVENDPDTLEFDEDTQDIFRDNIKYAQLLINIDNHLPVGADVKLYFSKDRGDNTIYDSGYSPDLYIPLELKAPVTTGDPGTASGFTSNSWNIELNESDLLLFTNPEVYFGMKLVYPHTAGMVKIRPSDYIYIEGKVTATLRTAIPEEDDEQEGGGS